MVRKIPPVLRNYVYKHLFGGSINNEVHRALALQYFGGKHVLGMRYTMHPAVEYPNPNTHTHTYIVVSESKHNLYIYIYIYNPFINNLYKTFTKDCCPKLFSTNALSQSAMKMKTRMT
jgi:hypothetical protein